VWFDTAPLVRGTFSEQVGAIQTAIQSGIMTRNEARAMMGYTPIEGGDEVLIGPNMLPVEQNQEMAADEDRTPNDASGSVDEDASGIDSDD
jgi:hypothetical protein